MCVNHKKVQRIVQQLAIQVNSFTRKSRKYSSFNTSIPHQKITTDTTEFKYYKVDEKGRMVINKLYLDPFMDLFNREIISYSISATPSALGIMTALNEAITINAGCKFRRTFHSDQGWAYQMKAYTHTLKSHKIYKSMSRKGNCHDNSVIENYETGNVLWCRILQLRGIKRCNN